MQFFSYLFTLFVRAYYLLYWSSKLIISLIIFSKYAAARFPVWIVSDARRLTDLQFFRSDCTICTLFIKIVFIKKKNFGVENKKWTLI